MQNNRFTVLFGARLSGNVRTAPILEARGINLLRQSPATVRIQALPETPQPGYDIYVRNLPVYLHAFFDDRDTTIDRYYRTIAPLSYDKCIPLGFPDIIVGWVRPIEETLETFRREYGARDVMSQGKPGMIVTHVNVMKIREIQNSNPITTFPAVTGCANLNTLGVVALSIRIASLFLHMHQYPAFGDREHYENFLAMEEEEESVHEEMTVDPAPTTVTGKKKEKTERQRREWDGRNQQYITRLRGLDKLPVSSFMLPTGPVSSDGLWFPYVSELSNPDKTTVPEVIYNWFLGALGENQEDASITHSRVCAEWGVLASTEWGKALAHIYRVIDIAIRVQGGVKLKFDGDVYLGAVITGSGWLVTVNERNFVPGSAEQLNDAINLSGSNTLILRRISTIIHAPDEARVAIEAVESMWQLRLILASGGVPTDIQVEVTNAARMLRFKTVHWFCGRPGVEKAAEYLSDNKSLADYGQGEDLPIRAEYIFSTDKTAVIWSCFGPMAPSFRIPGGSVFDLTAPTNTVKRVVGGMRSGKSESLPVTAVSSRVCALELAIEDLKRMIDDKKILNPFAQPRVKRSAANQYKVYSGNEMTAVITALRRICNATVSLAEGSKKRKAVEDTGEEPGSKRSALAFF